jgi:uncharacterized protein
VKCAGCEAGMQEFVLDGVTIDRCDRCGGVWLDAGEADDLVKKEPEGKDAMRAVKYELLRKWKVAASEPRPTERTCPRCDEHLARVNYKDVPGVQVDKCPKDCGLYLDRGELEKIRLID